MLTNNFYQAWRAGVSGLLLESAIKTLAGSIINCNGAADLCVSYLCAAFRNTARAVYKSPSDPIIYPGMVFGTGSVPPTLDDYWVSGNVLTTIEILLCACTTDIVDGVARTNNELTLKNTSDTDAVVINEIGAISFLFHKGGNASPCLVDRTVLDTPLTLAPGEQGVITYTFNLPIVQ